MHSTVATRDELASGTGADPDWAFLRRTEPPTRSGDGLPIVDLFAGCGGLTHGALEALRRAGRPSQLRLAVDEWPEALEVLADSLHVDLAHTLELDLGRLLDGDASAEALLTEAAGGEGGLMLAGPPCQGHSTLNNHSRHDDHRNDLYMAVAEAAGTLRPDAIIIENVRGVSADKRAAMHRCVEALKADYAVSDHTLDLHELGAPQRRLRHVVVATKGSPLDLKALESPEDVRGRTLDWAISDLAASDSDSLLDTASVPGADNARRLAWLADHPAEANLPDPQRPACHRDGPHSYRSMYGRLSWNLPAQTVTSGYGSMGQGRFVHPDASRTLTPHEAARLQMLPDYMDFRHVEHRSTLATMIGNAAPPILTIRIVEALLDQDLL